MPLELCIVMGQRGKKIFFLHFYAFQIILSQLVHTYFQNIYVSKRKMRASKAIKMHAKICCARL